MKYLSTKKQFFLRYFDRITNVRDSRLAYEQGEAGQSQESNAGKSGQRARDLVESSCKQT